MSIRAKLLFISLVPAALVSLLLIAFSVRSFQEYFHETNREELTARAEALARRVAPALVAGDSELAADQVDRVTDGSQVRVRVFLPGGTLFATSQPVRDRRPRNWLLIAGVKEALKGAPAYGIRVGTGRSSERFYVAVPVRNAGKVVGVVRLSLPTDQYRAQVSRSLREAGTALAGGLLGCALVGAVLARTLSAPIHRMSAFAKRIGAGHLGESLLVESRDELGHLAEELNRMSARLVAEDETRRLQLANITHEFLTPLTNVQVTLEALQAGAAKDPELRERFLENAFLETERLKHLLEESLDLARLEAGIAPLRLRSCSLAELLDHCRRAVESRLLLGGLTLEVSGAEVRLNADPDRLAQALLAILDNAVKHAPVESRIKVTIDSDATSVRISVVDQGPGIAAGDLSRIFEPFFVGDSAGTGGAGLGLAIARRIVFAHGGTIAATAEPGAGARVTITLPRDAAVSPGGEPLVERCDAPAAG